MFYIVVYAFVMLLLIIAGGAALHMGVFKAHKESTSFPTKAFGGLLSYGLSSVFWLLCYSQHYMGW